MATAIDVASVEISVLSSDPELTSLVRDVLADIRDVRCVLNVLSSFELPGSADLCIWDHEAGKHLPLRPGFRASRHLFLVDPSSLSELYKDIGSTQPNILTKPVERQTLESAVCLAISALRDHVGSTASLREQRDDLLQSLIQTSLRVQDHDHERASLVARAAHDFRAPATVVDGYCDLLLGEHPGPLNETQKEVLQRMQVSARRLSRTASAMFALSFGRSARPLQELLENDVRECVERAIQEIVTFADEKRIEITAELSPCDFPLFFDRGQIEQVLINILGNSCKFSPRAGVISVFGYTSTWESSRAASFSGRLHEGRPDANCYRVDIQDSGSPIPNDHLHRIFEEYAYSDGNRDRSDGGLGLAVTRIIMAQHDGHVWAENTANGPRFSLVLPRRQR